MGIEEYLQGSKSPSTAKRYLREIRLFAESVQYPEHAGYNEVMAYIGELRRQGISPAVPLASIKSYFDYLAAEGIRKDHPAKSIKLRDNKAKDIQLQDLFTESELEMLLERPERYPLLANRNRLIIGFLIYQALTNGEIKSLELSDINLPLGTVRIRAGRNNARTLRLRPNQAFWLMEYLNKDRPQLVRLPTNRLIVTKLGREESGEGIGYLLETAREMFPERRLNAIAVRQSVIANLLKAGHDLRVVQEFAGHKSPSTTEKYRQSQAEELKAEVLKRHPLG